MTKNSGNILLVILIAVGVLAASVGGYFWWRSSVTPPPKACTLEAKVCPDGSSVSRTGPNCEFTPCLTSVDPSANWKIYSNKTNGFSFKYQPDWTIDASQADEKQSAQLKLKKNDVTITIYANLYGIGGQGRDYEGTKIAVDGVDLYKVKTAETYSSSQTIFLVDKLKNTLGVFSIRGKIYSLTLRFPNFYIGTGKDKDIEYDFDQILSTFRFD